jgi:hypothetical protein
MCVVVGLVIADIFADATRADAIGPPHLWLFPGLKLVIMVIIAPLIPEDSTRPQDDFLKYCLIPLSQAPTQLYIPFMR